MPYPEQNGIHEKAVIDPTAKIGKNVSIGPGAYIGKMSRLVIIRLSMPTYVSITMQKLELTVLSGQV